MKIGILTLYNADYGSYYQAVSLYNQLESMGHQVELINILNRERRVVMNLIGAIVAKFCPSIARMIAKKIAPYNTYLILKNSLKNYRISKACFSMKKATSVYDGVVLGADELWSAANPYVKYIRTYYGYHISCPHISYATSGISLGRPGDKILEQIRKDLRSYTSIGVRDEFTKKWVEKFTEKKCTRVIDPTLLNPFFAENKRNRAGKYILIYGEFFAPDHVEAILDFAREKRLPIKSVSWKHNWCEAVEVGSTDDFELLFSEAAWVMTSTFHGTAFSIAYNKNFTAFDSRYRGRKLKALLAEFHLRERLFQETGITDSDIDYTHINSVLDEKREKSLEYMNNALNLIN